MKQILNAALAAIFVISAFGQRQIPSQTAQPGSTQDFSRAGVSRPMRVGTTLPATCRIGDQFFDSDATAGQNLYACTAANTWTQQAGGGGGGCAPAGSATEILVDDGAGGCDSTSATVDGSGNLAAASVATGASPPTCSVGTAGTVCLKEGTAATAEASSAICYADSTNHDIRCAFNNGSFFPLTRTIASGAEAIDTDEIASEDCDDQTITATGAASTDTAQLTPNANITAVTGYAPSTSGGLYWIWWVSANTINLSVCNPTAAPITPGAVTVNWRITR